MCHPGINLDLGHFQNQFGSQCLCYAALCLSVFSDGSPLRRKKWISIHFSSQLFSWSLRLSTVLKLKFPEKEEENWKCVHDYFSKFWLPFITCFVYPSNFSILWIFHRILTWDLWKIYSIMLTSSYQKRNPFCNELFKVFKL
jgi:hypothetical protein